MNLGYTEIYDLPLLREKIRKLYKTKNHILVFSVTEEAIYVAIRALFKAENQVILMTPCYQSLKKILKLIGAK
ncbi:aminotransferase class I/II-fold pyridoxal phosphate-dependent enzyme [Coxiella-like endosymbiont]|uniref:aminotransferase class I/II-fold pyridoxal phosphate-dependent enzyme n=1 Tax=Coxiella-like endosymbiont TaxID=1592897 RepID=UPI00272C1DD5|nr:aminotransferase class I/II-fold pyridoxal phosphate-dependent enzyme [Coxiella-like endosymbiont]